MSKHLRFGKLLGMLALLLTLSVAWSSVSAQNVSSAKVLMGMKFLQADNGVKILADFTGTIDQTARTVTFTLPWEYKAGQAKDLTVQTLRASFEASNKTNLFKGGSINVNPLGQGYGAGVWFASNNPVGGAATNYTYLDGDVITVEAENHSYEYYTVKFTYLAASTANSTLTFSGAWAKPWAGGCPPNGVFLQTEPGTFTGNNITFPVPFGTNLDAITIYFTMSPWATANHTTATAYDFDIDNNGVPEARVLTITSQSGATQNYNILPVVGPASPLDNLLSYAVTGSNSVVPNHTTQTIAVVIPWSTVTISPTWSVSPYAHTFTLNPLAGPAPEICSGTAWATAGAGPFTMSLWIQAEDPSEVSEYVITVTKAAASSAKDITAIDGTWSKATACGAATGSVVGSISGTTVTFNVPYGVTAVTLGALTKSALSTHVVSAAPMVTGTTITVTAEDGSTKVYTVAVTAGAASSAKQMLTFGFKMADNNPFPFPDWTVDYPATIDQNVKLINVEVAWNTDLYALKAYFTSSPYSCVYIVESDNSLTTQTTQVTVNDHSNSKTYLVKAEDGTEERYYLKVTKAAPLTGKDMIGFKLTGLSHCVSSMGTYDVAGVYTGTNIAVSVKYGTVLNNLAYSFTVSTGASSSITLTGNANFTNPVSVTVTAQDGSTQVYTITVTPRVQNSEKKILTYLFSALDNAGNGVLSDAVGTINEATKMIHVWVPWETRGANLTNLKARFTLSNGAIMTRSEDNQVLQASGVSANDYTTPIAYTVFAEDCSTVEYFVYAHVTPDVNTGISSFVFNVVGCECWSSTAVIDPYARRIHITLPNTMSITSLAPASIGLAAGATISPLPSVAQNWTTGPKKYTVTAPDGVAKADWMVWVENPKCTKTDIVTFTMPVAQVAPGDLKWASPVVIDAANHRIDVIIKKGVDKSKIYYERTLSCGATICCVDGACQDNQYLDFSTTDCRTCVVTAEDKSVTQEWTICVKTIDTTLPEVTTWSVMAYNCSDSVAVQSNEKGRVFIVHESAIDFTDETPVFNLADYTGSATAGGVAHLVAARLGNWAAVSEANVPVYVKTHGLYQGVYWAFSVDEWGNVSCISKQKLYLDICDVDVATLCDLRSQPPVWRFRVTGEIFVTYEESRMSGNWTFAQDANCGIMIEDQLGAWSTAWGLGAGLKNIMGTLDQSGPMMKFIPICCYLPTKSSTGNVVAPKEMTYDSFYSTAYNGAHVFESMLVKITNPMDVLTSGNWAYNTIYKVSMVDGSYTAGGDPFIETLFSNVDYLTTATAIPTDPAFITGIRFDVKPAATEYGKLVPLKKTHIVPATAPIILADPNPASVTGVVVGQCKSVVIRVYNEGVGNLPITALYLDDAAGTDGFQLMTPPGVPFTLGTWGMFSVTVNFCPLTSGAKSTNLNIEYGHGKVLVVPINGSTVRIVETMPFCDYFNTWPDNVGSYDGWVGTGHSRRYGSGGFVAAIGDGRAYNFSNPPQGGSQYLVSPGLVIPANMNDPIVTWSQGKIGIWGADSNLRKLFVSDNNQATWTEIYATNSSQLNDVYAGPGPWKVAIVSLDAYKGKTIFLKWESFRANPSPISSYWVLENICIQERVTTPLISVTPAGDFGGVQIGAPSTINFSIVNKGISVLNVKSVGLVGGADWSLTDVNIYPVEVEGTEVAYSVNGAASVNFSVTFNPAAVGIQNAKLVIVHGLWGDQVLEIPLSGEGLSCSTATEAFIGDNSFFQNSWFKYTAEKFQITTISSCHPHNDAGYNAVYAYDTYLYVYADCDGTLLGENDDMEAACSYNRASSSVQVVMNEGETVYIFWPLAFPTAEHAYDEMIFTITPNYPIDGDVCETAIPLTLPVVNHFGTTIGFNDDYDASPCSPFSNYMDGNDKVYKITLPYEGYLTGNILGAYGSIHVLDKCPKTELLKENCKAFASGPMGGSFEKRIQAGTYFVIISTWAPPQTVDFLLNMSFRGTGVDDSELMSNLSVFPNPTTGEFNVSISNAEASDLTLELVNISGQVVYRNEVKGVYDYTEKIDATEFAKGVYYLKVNNGEGVKIEKVVIQ